MLSSGDSVALLLDSAPRTWTSQEDLHLYLCQQLRKRDINLTLVFADPIGDDIATRFRDCGAQVEFCNYRGGRAAYLKRLKSIVARDRTSLIHICFFDYFSSVPWLARLAGCKRVIFEQLNSGQLTAVSWKRQLIQMRGALATQPVSKVIAISDFVRSELIKCGVASEKIAVRHLGVDTQRFSPDPNARQAWREKFQIAPDEMIISTVSVLRAFKNPETIVNACGLLAKRGVRFRLLVAGDGEMLPVLKPRAADLGLTDRIQWLGYCLDPKSLLQASDIFVLASTGEAFGLVLTEAMACGVPVVGSRSGAIPEIVEHGVTGLLATPKDEASFADALETISRDQPLRNRFGEQGVAQVRERFNVEKSVRGTLEIYDSL